MMRLSQQVSVRYDCFCLLLWLHAFLSTRLHLFVLLSLSSSPRITGKGERNSPILVIVVTTSSHTCLHSFIATKMLMRGSRFEMKHEYKVWTRLLVIEREGLSWSHLKWSIRRTVMCLIYYSLLPWSLHHLSIDLNADMTGKRVDFLSLLSDIKVDVTHFHFISFVDITCEQITCESQFLSLFLFFIV